MIIDSADHGLALDDQRLIAALQYDGRMTAELAGEVLNLPARLVQRRWTALQAGGELKVITIPPRPAVNGPMLLWIRVLRGTVDAVAQALAAREDIPVIELSADGDQLSAVLLADDGPGDRLVFRQLPAISAVTSIEAETVIKVFSETVDWRLDVLDPEERRRFAEKPSAEPVHPPSREPDLDEIDQAIAALLADQARMPAAAIARAIGQAESTVRRRLAALFGTGRLRTQVVVDPGRLGLGVDARVRMRVAPRNLEQTGRRLATHPAVHGALATTGAANLTVALGLPDLDQLYRFITEDLAELDVDQVETRLVGPAIKRPGLPGRVVARHAEPR
jgi:DNA-binding Lrp family transcriptional regulator